MVSSEMHSVGLGGHPSRLCASVSPPVAGEWCGPRAVWLQTQRFEEFTGKLLGKQSSSWGRAENAQFFLRSITRD